MVVFLGGVMINIAHLEEAQVVALAVDIAQQRLQSTEDQGLTHYAKVGAQRIHYLHRVGPRIGIELILIIIALFGE